MSGPQDATLTAVDELWMTTQEVAELLKVPVPTVRAWRHNGSGPDGVRLGRHVRYRHSSVVRWITSREQAQQGTSP